jgi:hypothetical protein
MSIKRGGQTLKEGLIGHCNVLRQQILMPGERMDIRLKGKVRLEALRERDVMRINAHHATFVQPLRWLQSNWPDYVKKTTTTQTTSSISNAGAFGIGGYMAVGRNVQKYLVDAPINIYNKWYKWPEDSDVTNWLDDGHVAVPLSSAWNRCRYTKDPGTSSEYTVTAASDFDVRTLAEKQAEFKSAMKREITSYNRWMELIGQTWKGDGSREVDQVPIMLDQTEVGVNPRELPATDGASLGQWQSLYDFEVDHSIRGYTAPEHMIMTHILTIRFPPIIEGLMPLSTDTMNWYEHVGDPEWTDQAQPQEVQIKDLATPNSATSLGYLPAGWQWRCEHDVVGARVDLKDSFPYMETPTSQANAKDASRTKNAFRSSTLGDYMVDIYYNEDSYQPVGTARDSYFSGMLDQTKNIGQSNDEFPFGGKML